MSDEMVTLLVNVVLLLFFGAGGTKVTNVLTQRVQEVVDASTAEIVQAQHETSEAVRKNSEDLRALTIRVEKVERTVSDGAV